MESSLASNSRRKRRPGHASSGILLALWASLSPLGLAAQAQSEPSQSDLQSILKELQEQKRELAAQRKMLRDQQAVIEALKRKLAGNASAPEPAPGAPAALASVTPPQQQVAAAAQPEHVGEAPAQPEKPPELPAIANVGGVLTNKGTLIAEPFVEYERTSTSNFTFEGIQIIDAFLIGLINAGQNQQDLVDAGVTFRYGVLDRLEAELRVPYVYRSNRFVGSLLDQNNTNIIQSSNGSGIGDIEAALHYQVNDGQNDWPFFVANLRVKSNTGTGPFDIGYNNDGSPQSLPTGSGFWAIEPSVTFIYPSDPAVLFGNIGYIHNFGGNVNRMIGKNIITDVEPGDTFSGMFGIGLALNDRLSITLGYEHDYIRPTSEVLNGISQRTEALQVGTFQFGIAFKENNRLATNIQLGVGATRDAPDVTLTLRVPLSLAVGPLFPWGD